MAWNNFLKYKNTFSNGTFASEFISDILIKDESNIVSWNLLQFPAIPSPFPKMDNCAPQQVWGNGSKLPDRCQDSKQSTSHGFTTRQQQFSTDISSSPGCCKYLPMLQLRDHPPNIYLSKKLQTDGQMSTQPRSMLSVAQPDTAAQNVRPNFLTPKHNLGWSYHLLSKMLTSVRTPSLAFSRLDKQDEGHLSKKCSLSSSARFLIYCILSILRKINTSPSYQPVKLVTS